MPEPSRLAVTPSLLADVGRSLDGLRGGLDRAAAHLAGPRPAPPVGDVACGISYQSAAHQLAGLVTTTSSGQRALSRSLTAAAVLYAQLDRQPVRR